MNKTAIAPIVTVICMGIGVIIGHPIGETTQAEIATIAAAVITAAVSIWGVVKNHKV